MAAPKIFQALRRSGVPSSSRSYGLLSNISKTTQEAVDKTKAAAEELQRAAGMSQAAEQLKQHAAAATSTISETLAQAQELAQETVDELLKGAGSAEKTGPSSSNSSSSGGGGGAGDGAQQGTQQQQQQRQREQGHGASSGSASSPASLLSRVRQAAGAALQEMRAAVLPEVPSASALRGSAAKAGDIKTSSTSELLVTAQAEGSWAQKQWREMRDKLGGHPMFRSVAGLKDSRMFEAGREAAEKVRERWETSDSPLVHKIQDATDSFFAEGEAAQALREIRARDPAFDMVRFLQHLKQDVQVVIRAYLSGDKAVIREHCSPEMIERLTGIMAAVKAAGQVQDPTLLDTSEVELVDLKMLDDSPIVVTQFTCQQINCVRDAHGTVVEGAPDEVHRVYYYWALQQEAAGFVGADGAYHPPRWQLREMLIRGMHALL